MDMKWSTRYADTYANWLATQLTVKLGWCSEQTVYAAWNVGLSRVVNVNGDLTRINDTTQDKCRTLSSVRHVSR